LLTIEPDATLFKRGTQQPKSTRLSLLGTQHESWSWKGLNKLLFSTSGWVLTQ
jgi:hypothetical protein